MFEVAATLGRFAQVFHCHPSRVSLRLVGSVCSNIGGPALL
jgi:hypothetical protein